MAKDYIVMMAPIGRTATISAFKDNQRYGNPQWVLLESPDKGAQALFNMIEYSSIDNVVIYGAKDYVTPIKIKLEEMYMTKFNKKIEVEIVQQ